MSGPRPLRFALKEWAVTIAALREGRQILLLRKGGIHEPHGDFRPTHDSFALFPGFEHQRRELLKPEAELRYERLLDPAADAGPLVIDTCARLEAAIELTDQRAAYRLAGEHVWSEAYVRARVEYKPEKPLYVLLLRVAAIEPAVEIPRLARYAGCRSWVELEQHLDLASARPVLPETELLRRVARLRERLGAEGRGSTEGSLALPGR